MRVILVYQIVAILLTGGLAARVWAADTTEPFDVGATDVELYGAFDGMGPAPGERALAGELMAGFIATLPSPARLRVASSEPEGEEALADGGEERGQQTAPR